MLRITAWLWTGFAACAAVFVLSRPGQALAGILLILSALAACPLSQSFLERQARVKLGAGPRLGLAFIFLGLAGIGIAQNMPVLSGWPQHAPASRPIVPKTLVEESGDFGNKRSEPFTPQGTDWTLEWSFDCASLGDSGNFNVKVVRAGGDVLASVEKIGDRDSGTEHYRQAGSFYLQVVSECRWQVRAAG
ncbi:MAG TPA: hypothetical protein VG501_07230 [Rhizomicrobium sp.]|nr:hypothetical protein [Rhizomicrobium sp.]